MHLDCQSTLLLGLHQRNKATHDEVSETLRKKSFRVNKDVVFR